MYARPSAPGALPTLANAVPTFGRVRAGRFRQAKKVGLVESMCARMPARRGLEADFKPVRVRLGPFR
jgi:hypothetical protein